MCPLKFTLIPDSSVVLKAKGVYTPTTVYHYDGKVFAKKGNSYIRLLSDSTTTLTGTTYTSLTPTDCVCDKGAYLEYTGK